MAEDSDLTRQSLALLGAFKATSNNDLREFIVQAVTVLQHSPDYAWPPFKTL